MILGTLTLSVTLLSIGTPREGHAQFITPLFETSRAEYYEFLDDRIGIYTQLVTWNEAAMICKAANGSLIEYIADDVPVFIGRALAESAVGFGVLWVGGQLITERGEEVAVWKWTTSDVVIDTNFTDDTMFPMNNTPYWVGRPAMESGEPLCLGTDRNKHDIPLIVHVRCQELRPFICRLPSNSDNTKPKPIVPPIVSFPKTFQLFQGQVTWLEALGHCSDRGMKLAVVTTEAESKVIGNRMLRTRPVVENAWIGGSFSNGKWRWIGSNRYINTNQSNATGEVPWYQPNNITMDGCLLADRHVCDHFVYVEAKCDRRRNFICERESRHTPDEVLIKVGNYSYYVSFYVDTWHGAMKACRRCLNGELLQIEANAEVLDRILPFLYEAMAMTLQNEIRHVWIGGYLYGNQFMWTNDPNHKPESDKILDAKKYEDLRASGEKGILEYCDVDLTAEPYLLKYKCLNLDRENQKNYFMYGLTCGIKQHFICRTSELDDISKECDRVLRGRRWPRPDPSPRPTGIPDTVNANSDGILIKGK